MRARAVGIPRAEKFEGFPPCFIGIVIIVIAIIDVIIINIIIIITIIIISSSRRSSSSSSSSSTWEPAAILGRPRHPAAAGSTSCLSGLLIFVFHYNYY